MQIHYLRFRKETNPGSFMSAALFVLLFDSGGAVSVLMRASGEISPAALSQIKISGR